MSQRLPIPGADDGTWGQILNDFLQVAHNTDGTISQSALTIAGAYIKPTNGIPGGDIGAGAVTDAHLAANAGIATTKLEVSAQVNLAKAASAIQVGGDIAGSSTAPVVAKVNGVSVSGTPTAGQVLTASGAANASWQTPAAGGVTASDGGTWSSSISYSAGSIVTYAGSRYITALGAPANSYFDTSKWILLGAVPDTF